MGKESRDRVSMLVFIVAVAFAINVQSQIAKFTASDPGVRAGSNGAGGILPGLTSVEQQAFTIGEKYSRKLDQYKAHCPIQKQALGRVSISIVVPGVIRNQILGKQSGSQSSNRCGQKSRSNQRNSVFHHCRRTDTGSAIQILSKRLTRWRCAGAFHNHWPQRCTRLLLDISRTSAPPWQRRTWLFEYRLLPLASGSSKPSTTIRSWPTCKQMLPPNCR